MQLVEVDVEHLGGPAGGRRRVLAHQVPGQPVEQGVQPPALDGLELLGAVSCPIWPRAERTAPVGAR